jgi:hypothetical protein
MAAALVGALAGAAFLLIVFNRHPDLTFDMDRICRRASRPASIRSSCPSR